jgi:hypothetical protein
MEINVASNFSYHFNQEDGDTNVYFKCEIEDYVHLDLKLLYFENPLLFGALFKNFRDIVIAIISVSNLSDDMDFHFHVGVDLLENLNVAGRDELIRLYKIKSVAVQNEEFNNSFRQLPDDIRREIKNFTIFKPKTKKELKTAVNLYYSVKYFNDNEFRKYIEKYGHISTWDISLIIDTSHLFEGMDEFNEDISNWNVSGIKNTSFMFSECYSFTHPLNWELSRDTNMYNMFRGCSNFKDLINCDNYDQMLNEEDKEQILRYGNNNVVSMPSMPPMPYLPVANSL